MPDAPPRGPETGILAGRYQLRREIDRGAMGIVYEAYHLETGRRCAVKLLRPEVSGDRERVQRFIKEARAGSLIDSDHIVKVIDAGTENSGRPYLVMEYLHGQDLRRAMRQASPLSSSAAIKIALQASLGLAKAHLAGVVHRDIKPENLFLTTGEWGSVVVKVLDFGVAKFKATGPKDTLYPAIDAGALLGTPLYMSPEQFRGESEVSPASDVWSLGVVLWEMLTGAPPFQSRTLDGLASSVTCGDLPCIRARAPWVDRDIAEIITRALAREPSDRFADAGELLEALQAITDGPQLDPSALRPVDATTSGGFLPDDLGVTDILPRLPRRRSKPERDDPDPRAAQSRRQKTRTTATVVTLGVMAMSLGAWTLGFGLPKRDRGALQTRQGASPLSSSSRAPRSSPGSSTEQSAATSNSLTLGSAGVLVPHPPNISGERGPSKIKKAKASPAPSSGAQVLDPETGLVITTTEFKTATPGSDEPRLP
jgi:serine/threonine protein kinase